MCENYHINHVFLPKDIPLKDITLDCKICGESLTMYFINVTSGKWYRFLNDEQLEKIEKANAKKANEEYELQKAEEEALAKEELDRKNKLVEEEVERLNREEKEKIEKVKEELVKEKQEKDKRVRELRKKIKDIESEKVLEVNPVDAEPGIPPGE